jgi:DNA-dependent RNA polymerase auxiliary subunit epsilon
MLERQLDQETRKFLSEERNYRIDHEKKAIFLSSIFKWYEKDFLSWYQDRFPKRNATLLDYIALYLSEDKAEELKKNAAGYRIRFIPYDWGLNNQK